MSWLHVYLCTTCPPGALIKRASDPLELELWMLVSHHVGAGLELGCPTKAASALNCGAIPPAPPFQFFVLTCIG